MAEAKQSRFVIIDGVQIDRARAVRRGLIKAGDAGPSDGPSSNRARTSASARKGGGGGPHSSGKGKGGNPAPAKPEEPQVAPAADKVEGAPASDEPKE